MASRKTADCLVGQKTSRKSKGPPEIQFDNLRIATLNCKSLDAKSILEYCEKSGCDIVALQDADDLCEDPRIIKYHPGMVFFIKDSSSIEVSSFEWENDHPGIGILHFSYKNVEFTFVNIVSDSGHLQKCLKPIRHEVDKRILIIWMKDHDPRPGFSNGRTDILQDIASFGDRMIGSLWRVSKGYEEYRKTASKEELMKCKVFEPLNMLEGVPGHKTIEKVVLDRLNQLFSDPGFHIGEEPSEKIPNTLRLTLEEIRKHFPKPTSEDNIKSACKQFNDALSDFNIPSKWKDIHLKLPNQSVFPQKVEYYENFPWEIDILREVYSNVLAQKCNPGSMGTENWEHQRKIEKILILVLLLQKYKKSSDSLYFLFIKFKNPYDSVKISSVLNSLKKSNVPSQLYHSFASLLTDNRVILETSKGDLKSDKKKLRGIHLGHLANSFLLRNVIKSMQDQWDSLDVSGIKIGDDESLKNTQFEEHLVLIDSKVTNFEHHLDHLSKISTSHGLVFDELTLMKNSTRTGETKFPFRGTEVKTAKRFVSFLGQTISVKENLKYEIERRLWEVKELIKSTSSLESMDVISKLMFFKNTIVPKFFYACETWTPSGKEIQKITSHLAKLSEELEIPYHFDVYRKILSEKARFIKWIVLKPDSVCNKLLYEESKRSLRKKKNADWSFELVKNFKLFNGSVFEAHGTNLLNIAARNFELWDDFITYCETKAKRSLNWRAPQCNK